MVAVIKTGKSLSRILNYNEHKLKEGVAEGLGARNYLVDFEHLTFTQKLYRLTHQAALNDKVTTNSFHVSLNFDKSDKLSKEKLLRIADRYMEGIGFGDQPYLVYEHRDAGHPHIHIVSVRVRDDGSRIDVHNLGRNQSEKARKAIEQEFHLVRAEGQRLAERKVIRPVPITPAEYGKKETKEAIATVLNAILPRFNYTSLPELNAILGLYNVVADRGKKDSRLYQKGGLTYRILDKQGIPKGVPIKASDFSFRPILRELESRFQKNEQNRQELTDKPKTGIDQELAADDVKDIKELVQRLAKRKIVMVSRIAKTGQTYGLTYVDLQNKVVCNGSELGKRYSAAGIMNQLNGQEYERTHGQKLSLNLDMEWLIEPPEAALNQGLTVTQEILAELLRPELTQRMDQQIPNQLKKKQNRPKL